MLGVFNRTRTHRIIRFVLPIANREDGCFACGVKKRYRLDLNEEVLLVSAATPEIVA
jgi:hypothetical protein